MSGEKPVEVGTQRVLGKKSGISSQGRKWKSRRVFCPESQEKTVYQRSKEWSVILIATEELGSKRTEKGDNVEVIDYLYKSDINGIMGTKG